MTADFSLFNEINVIGAPNCPEDVFLIGEIPTVEVDGVAHVDWPTMIRETERYARGGIEPRWRMIKLATE
jgi:hypothetical protein